MSKEQWTVIGVGVALAALLVGLAGLLGGQISEVRSDLGDLRERMARVELRLDYIEDALPPNPEAGEAERMASSSRPPRGGTQAS